MNKTKLMNKLNKDIRSLERKIQYTKLYNTRNCLINLLLRFGIVLDFSVPFIMTFIVVANTKFVNTKDLITYEDKVSRKNIETIDTSDGSHIENINSNIYDKNFIECSYVFKSDKNNYERKTVTYEVNDEIDLNSLDNILSMDNDELVKFLDKLNLKSSIKIEKSDYVDDIVKVVNHKVVNEKYKVLKLTDSNLNNILRLNAMFWALCWIYKMLQKLILKGKLKDLLEEKETYFKPITDEELELINKLLESRRKNINLLLNERGLEEKKDVPIFKKEKFMNNYISDLKNNYFSYLRGSDLQEVLVDVENYFLTYRDTLNLPRELTFGVELEYEKLFKIVTDEFLEANFLYSWKSINDGSLILGGEVVSPILNDDISTWNQLQKICQFLAKYNADTFHNAGGHIHIGANILGEDIESWKMFLKLYTIYEHVLFRFAYGDKLNARKEIKNFAFPSKENLNMALLFLDDAIDLSDIYYAIPNHSRYQALNLCNIPFTMLETQKKFKNTIEFRFPNASSSEIVWQNNINAFAKMLLTAKNKLIDEEFLDYKIKTSKDEYINYDFIDLKGALEFVDLVFDNNLDKTYFLRQYFKNYQENYDKNRLVRAKKFIK
ncbi:hypothetical protein EGR52_07320 [bacterium]|nr:hypothetical protein [bacterium]